MDADGNDITHPNIFRMYVLITLLVIIWGLSWPINKIGLAFMPPIWYAAFRLLIGMVSLFAIVFFGGKFVIPNRRDLPIIVVFGFLQMTLFMTLITIGLHYVSAGRSAILVYTTPIWVMPLAILFFNEKLTVYKAVGFLLGMVGILILFSPWEIDWSNRVHMTWYRTPLELVPWQLLFGMLFVFTIAYIEEPAPLINWNHTLISSLLFTGALGAAFGYWGTMVVSKELPSITVSLCYLAIPVVSMIFSAFLVHEPIIFITVVAMLFILAGIACVVWGNYKQNNQLNT
jgi:drug/metabolite transporter (DMT)-like permease